MAKKLTLGIIGSSVGNGHPYSWSAIFNGYNYEEMKGCPYPVIPEYLSKQVFPDDFLYHRAEVTHIWTQNFDESLRIARASRIRCVCKTSIEMIGVVDGVLLARDDAENHFEIAKPFIEAGMYIFIDKPFAFTLHEATRLWDLELFSNQIFTCSSFNFATEFSLMNLTKKDLGDIKFIDAQIPKSWIKYAVHIIEPVLNLLPLRGDILSKSRNVFSGNEVVSVSVLWQSGVITRFTTVGSLSSEIFIRVCGSNGHEELVFRDTFQAFKSSLDHFVQIVCGNQEVFSRRFTQDMIEILEFGNNA